MPTVNNDEEIEKLKDENDVNREALENYEKEQERKKKKIKIDWVAIVALIIALCFIGAIVYIVVDTVNYVKDVDLAAPEAVVETIDSTSAPDTENITETDPVDETIAETIPETTTAVITEPVNDILPKPTESIPAEKKEPVVEETETTTKPDSTEPNESDKDDEFAAERRIFIYLTEHLEYSKAAACGIIANIAYETGWKFNPDVGDIDYGAYGLIQWMGNRRRQLKSWCEETGRDWRTMEGQMDFMDWELKNDDPYGTYDCLTEVADSTKGAYRAGWYFCYWYERPNRKDKASEWRGGYAKKYYKSLVLGE